MTKEITAKTLAIGILLLSTAGAAVSDETTGKNKPAPYTLYDLWKPAVGGIIGAATVPVYLFFWKWWTKPVLGVFVERNGMILDVPLRTPTGESDGFWKLARICVKNTGKRRATNCSATLIKIERVDGSTRTLVDYHDYLPLTWSNRDSKPIELGPHVPNNLDLCRLVLPQNRFQLSFDPLPFVYESLIDNDGGYWLHVLLTADEAKPKRFSVRVDCNKANQRVSVDSNISE